MNSSYKCMLHGSFYQQSAYGRLEHFCGISMSD